MFKFETTDIDEKLSWLDATIEKLQRFRKHLVGIRELAGDPEFGPWLSSEQASTSVKQPELRVQAAKNENEVDAERKQAATLDDEAVAIKNEASAVKVEPSQIKVTRPDLIGNSRRDTVLNLARLFPHPQTFTAVDLYEKAKEVVEPLAAETEPSVIGNDLNRILRDNEIVLVQKGKRGRNGSPAIYRNPKSRPRPTPSFFGGGEQISTE